MLGRVWSVLGIGLFAVADLSVAQQQEAPRLQVGELPAELRLDGRLDEAAWASAEAISSLTMVEPEEGVAASFGTEIRVLADGRTLVFGITCRDPHPESIVSWSVARDASQRSEDHIRLVMGTFRDGRSGYVFSVNPKGARFDGLISGGGEYTDSSWDGIWEAAAVQTAEGWSTEIRIPIRSLRFGAGLKTWDFNVERWIERLQERDRWAGASRDWRLTQTTHAGLLSGLPDFNLGWGWRCVRPW